MTEYHDENYFCIFKDPALFAMHCGNPSGEMLGGIAESMIDLGTGSIEVPTLPPTLLPVSSVPEPSAVAMMVAGVLVLCVVRFFKRKYNV